MHDTLGHHKTDKILSLNKKRKKSYKISWMKITKFLTAINELRLCEFDNKKKWDSPSTLKKREVSCCGNVEQQWKTIFLVCALHEKLNMKILWWIHVEIFLKTDSHILYEKESLDIRPRVRQWWWWGLKKEKFIVHRVWMSVCARTYVYLYIWCHNSA